MTLTTTFVNKTTLTFKLKEGDNGVYKELCTLRGLPHENAQPSDESKITLEFDARSTYKEYRVVTSSRAASEGRVSAPVKILICSDFIMDNSTIYIVPNPTPNADSPHNYFIKGDLRPASNFWPVSKLLRLLKKK